MCVDFIFPIYATVQWWHTAPIWYKYSAVPLNVANCLQILKKRYGVFVVILKSGSPFATVIAGPYVISW